MQPHPTAPDVRAVQPSLTVRLLLASAERCERLGLYLGQIAEALDSVQHR
jgi:hypothetical protein